MTDMRALINSLNQTEAIVEAELAAMTSPASPGAAFGAWNQAVDPMDAIDASAVFHAGALLGRQLRHVLERHPEFTFEESKGEHDIKFTVKGPTDFLEALKRIVAKLTDAGKVVDEAETIETHASREPTDEENDEAFEAISSLVKTGHTSGHAALSTGARYSWTLSGDGVVEDDEFAQEYVAGLIADGYREGHNPRWALALNVWGDRLQADSVLDEEDLPPLPDGSPRPAHLKNYVDQAHYDGLHNEEVSPRDEGHGAAEQKMGIEMNPYSPGSDEYFEWEAGYEEYSDGLDGGSDAELEDDGSCWGSISGEHRYVDGVCTRCMSNEKEIDEGHEELTYPNGEVYHTEYDAPAEGSKVVDKHGRQGTMISHEPSRHGHEFSPDIEVEWDDEPGMTYRMTADDVTEVPHTVVDEDMDDLDDGIADAEVLGLDDVEGSDVGSDFCFGSPTGEHHFVQGECVDCGQDESFEVDEQDVDAGDFETPGFSDEERIPR